MFTNTSIAPTMLKTLHDEISLDAALEEEQNMLHRLTYWQKRSDLIDYLRDNKSEIESVVSQHLNLKGGGRCSLSPLREWINELQHLSSCLH